MRPGCPPRQPSSRSGCWGGSRCCGARKRSRCARSAAACCRDALGLWHGEPLAEDTYAEWAQQDRRLLSLEFLETLECAAAAALACGDPASALTWAEQAAVREPLRETPAMLAVRALAAGGDLAGALAAFGAFG